MVPLKMKKLTKINVFKRKLRNESRKPFYIQLICETITAVFPTLFHRSSLLFNSLKIFRVQHGDFWFKNDVLRIMLFFVEKL